MSNRSRKSAPWRLGLDLGTNSLGWCVFDLKRESDGRQRPVGIRRMGVRIFSDGRDPQSGASLAEERRGPRSARRRRDRFLMRRASLLHALIRNGLLPADPAERRWLSADKDGAMDPWRLRAEGLDRPLTAYELGRVFFHLNQRRGFKSNRKADRRRDEKEVKDAQDMKSAARKLEELIGPDHPDARTIGEHLYKSFRAVKGVDGTWQPLTPASAATVRIRPRTVKGRNEYDFYPTRKLMEAEFDALWAAQAPHHPALGEAAREEIRRVIFHQRPLKPVDPGPCTLDPTDKRAPLALPIVQESRILQELANLELFHKKNPTVRRRLTLKERDRLVGELRCKEKVTFKRIRKLLGIEDIWGFNLESEKRDHLKGDVTSVRLGHPQAFGPRWWDGFDDGQRHDIVARLLELEEEDEAIRVGVESWSLTPEAADHVANVPLPDGYGRIGLQALSKIVPILRTEVDMQGNPIHFSDAVQRAGFAHHSDFRDGEILDALPYYGEVLSRYTAPVRSLSAPKWEQDHGRIANPTVHIGLRQVEKLINKLIERYGHPEEIVVELARDLKRSREQREEIQKRQAENQRKNDQRKEKLAEIGETPRGDRLLRMRLWEELNPGDPADRRCLYTGEQISISRLFSAEVEIEHILPFTLSLDDNPANLTVSLRAANRFKLNQTPHEAFGASPTVNGFRYDWEAIMLRVSALPKAKQWRFRPDAMELVRSRLTRDLAGEEGQLPREVLEDIERTGGFLARQLIDTAYLARVTRQYLWKICDPNKTWVIPGQMTALLRRKWGLNGLLSDHNLKNRADHRHHAIDAFVVGLTDRSLLQHIATAAGKSQERLIDDMPEPWAGFRDELRDALQRVTVSHRPDHSPQGRLHEETAYGVVKGPAIEGGNVVYRKPIDALSVNEVERVRDPVLREKLKAHLGPLLIPDSGAVPGEGDLLAAGRPGRKPKPKVRVAAKDLRQALSEFGRDSGIRHVRIVKPEAGVVPIRDSRGQVYKAYSPGKNHRIDIFSLPDGRWSGEAITVFDANRAGFEPSWMTRVPGSRLVMQVYKGDLIKLIDDGQVRIMRVVRLEAEAERLRMAGHTEGGNLSQRHDDPDDPFRWLFVSFNQLRARAARKVTVDWLSRVRDPGPPR